MPEGGTLRIEVDEHAGRVRLAVADTGQGMPPEVLEHVFEPFFTTKTAGRGTGLGLATCYGIVSQLGGQIAVTSLLGAGSTFTVLLPPAAEPPERVERRAAEAVQRGRETVLLVEDDPLVRELAATALDLHGYRVLSAASPEDALRIAREEPGPLDLLVTDVIMPGMDGRRLAAEVRRVRPIEVLFVSGYTADRLEEGARFLQKPFTPGLLARAVREALDARS
jgi:CheY-like chemotaxis protein